MKGEMLVLADEEQVLVPADEGHGVDGNGVWTRRFTVCWYWRFQQRLLNFPVYILLCAVFFSVLISFVGSAVWATIHMINSTLSKQWLKRIQLRHVQPKIWVSISERKTTNRLLSVCPSNKLSVYCVKSGQRSYKRACNLNCWQIGKDLQLR